MTTRVAQIEHAKPFVSTVRRDVWVRPLTILLLVMGGQMPTADAQSPTGQRRARLPLELLPDTLAICRLPADAPMPTWASTGGPFLTLSRTADELSITMVQRSVPPGIRCERDYRALRVRGSLPPNLVGILLSIAEPLAEAGLSIFAISTYETDYVLVKARDLDAALEALRKAGHQLDS